MRKLLTLIFALLLTFSVSEAWAEEPELIDNWAADSPAMQSIVQFVTDSVDEASDGYIPKADRVAVFDMDGTLYGERFPTYFNDWLFIQRALYDDSFEAPEELKAFAQAWEDKVLRGVPIDDFDAKERELGPQLYEGLTPEVYAEVVRKFKALPVYGFENMTYGEAYFQPMVSLVKYLYDHDYTVYIVSATYRDAVRVMTEGVLDEWIPADHVIGTDVLYVASGDEAEDSMFYELMPEDELVVAGRLWVKNQKTNKATAIQREIGKMPVLAFGNSTGDFSMATYTLQNKKYGGRAYMLLCDDTAHDYGDPAAAAAFKAKCDANGFYTISEKAEFETLYPHRAYMSDREVPEDYTLEQVVVLSRHNIRAPLSNSGSAVAELTPHTWTEWTAKDSELTLKGGVAETRMGQYFRKWLEKEGLIPEDYIPEDGEVRFYANARQRTIATSKYFSAAMFPIADIPIEYKGEIGENNPVFKPMYSFVSDAYREAVEKQLKEQFGLWEDGAARRQLAEEMALLADVIDYRESHGYRSGTYTDWTADDIDVVIEEGKETSIKGSIKTAMAASDALVLQYYELDDAVEAAFGRKLTDAEWAKIAEINTTYQQLRYAAPLIGINTAHPMLMEIQSEMQNTERKFSFLCGHDANVATVLSALGVTDYRLPGTVESRTPIGCKLLFETWLGVDGEEYARVRLVYQSTEQLRDLTALTPENPPVSFAIDLPGLARNADGFYRLEDVTACLQNAIDAYDELIETYRDESMNLNIAA